MSMLNNHADMQAFDAQKPRLLLRTKCLTYLSLQFFLTNVYLIVSQFKHEFFMNICARYFAIYFAIAGLILSVMALNSFSGKHRVIDLAIFAVLAYSMGWCIVYLIKFFEKQHVLNAINALFGSILGMRIYAGLAESQQSEEGSQKIDLFGCILGSSAGTIITMNVISYVFAPFNLISTVSILVLSLCVSLFVARKLRQICRKMEQNEQMSPIKAIGFLYSDVPQQIWKGLKLLGKKLIQLICT